MFDLSPKDDGSVSTDVYTRRSIETASDEHVVPNFLGGRLLAARIIDRTTNNQFGDGIDAALGEGLRALRVLLGALSAEGEHPRSLYPVLGADGKTYTVESGGVMIATPDVRTTKRGSELQIEGSVPNEQALRNMLRSKARRSNLNLDDLIAKFMATAKERLVAPPAMTFELPLWDRGPYRCTAKIACNLLALRHPELFLEHAFDPIRAFVLDGVEPVEPPVQATESDSDEEGIGPLDHLVRVDMTPAGDVVALVRYFKFLVFVVKLGHFPGVPQAAFSYRVDQLGRKDRVDHPDDLAVAIPSFAKAAARSFDDFESVVLRQRDQVVAAALSHQNDLWLHRLIGPYWNQMLEQMGDRERPTPEQVLAFSTAVASAVTGELAPRIAEASRLRNEVAAAEFAAHRLASDDKDPL